VPPLSQRGRAGILVLEAQIPPCFALCKEFRFEFLSPASLLANDNGGLTERRTWRRSRRYGRERCSRSSRGTTEQKRQQVVMQKRETDMLLILQNVKIIR